MKQRRFNMFFRPSKEVALRPVNKPFEVNKRTFMNEGKINKEEKKKKIFSNIWITTKVLIFYPIVTLTCFFILFALPEIVILIPMFYEKIGKIFSSEQIMELQKQTIEILTFEAYSKNEYEIYKKLFLNLVSPNDAREQLRILWTRLNPEDQILGFNRSNEAVVKSYINKFFIELHGSPDQYTFFDHIKYFFNNEKYALRINFTENFEIPTLTLSEYLKIKNNYIVERHDLLGLLSVADRATIESNGSPVLQEEPQLPLAKRPDVPKNPSVQEPFQPIRKERSILQEKPPTSASDMVIDGPAVNLEYVRGSLAILENHLQNMDKNYTTGQKDICERLNEIKTEMIAAGEASKSKVQTLADKQRIDTNIQAKYQEVSQGFQEASDEITTEYIDDFNTIKAINRDNFKARSIEISEHPVMLREPVDHTVIIPTDIHKPCTVKNISESND